MKRCNKLVRKIELDAILARPVAVRIDGVETKLDPLEAQLEQCAQDALKGNFQACKTFIEWCYRDGIIPAYQPTEDKHELVTVPKDWDHGEFVETYKRLGPPPWPGERDGLTGTARAARQEKSERRLRQ